MFGRLGNGIARWFWLARNRKVFRDNGPSRRPRLLVDVSVIMRRDARTGIQRVVRSIWAQLSSVQSADFDIVPVFASRTHGYCFAPTDFLSSKRRTAAMPVGVREGDKFLGLDLSAHYLPNWAPQLTSWRANGASVHVVVYDLLPLSRPDWFEPSTSRHFERWLNTLMRECDQVLCISDRVAQEFRSRIRGTRADQQLKVGRLHLSGDIAGSIPSLGGVPAIRSLLDHVRAHPSILMVGTVEPRKGYDRALDAFEELWLPGEQAPHLIIIGKPGWKTSDLQIRLRNHPEQGRRLHWLDDVSDEALTGFYDACFAVFCASYDEGFGLPVAEAATHRRWALVRDLPVFREQGLPNLRYFNDDAPEALANDLRAILATAHAGLPPLASPPGWTWCVERLLEEMDLAASDRPVGVPLLRVVR